MGAGGETRMMVDPCGCGAWFGDARGGAGLASWRLDWLFVTEEDGGTGRAIYDSVR